MFQYIINNSPITSLPDLLNIHHSNPLGIAPVWQLLFILVMTIIMELFMFQIRWRQKPQYYPILYVFFGIITLSLYYYCFQGGLPSWANKEYICWFSNHNIVGWGWAIIGYLCAIAVIYILLCAIQQVCAELTMKANPALIKSKPWKELKLGVGIAMFLPVFTGIGLLISDTAASWLFLASSFILSVFTLVKMILDIRRTKSFVKGLFIELVFFISVIPICMLCMGCTECSVVFLIAVLALFTGSKARKKEKKK